MEKTLLIIQILTSFGCFIFSISNIILLYKNKKLNDKMDKIKYWLSSVDREELIKISAHDVRYLDEARKILDVV